MVIGTKDHMLEAQDYIVKWLASGMAELIHEFQDCIVDWLANGMDWQWFGDCTLDTVVAIGMLVAMIGTLPLSSCWSLA